MGPLAFSWPHSTYPFPWDTWDTSSPLCPAGGCSIRLPLPAQLSLPEGTLPEQLPSPGLLGQGPLIVPYWLPPNPFQPRWLKALFPQPSLPVTGPEPRGCINLLEVHTTGGQGSADPQCCLPHGPCTAVVRDLRLSPHLLPPPLSPLTSGGQLENIFPKTSLITCSIWPQCDPEGGAPPPGGAAHTAQPQVQAR